MVGQVLSEHFGPKDVSFIAPHHVTPQDKVAICDLNPTTTVEAANNPTLETNPWHMIVELGKQQPFKPHLSLATRCKHTSTPHTAQVMLIYGLPTNNNTSSSLYTITTQPHQPPFPTSTQHEPQHPTTTNPTMLPQPSTQ
eukprot:NODE_1963_length_796_cov_73.736278_g1559_i0.p1 GENE.NODE_1963_length_796_cov_73.736278_g1559_i0~~NODE_1963_length_796_cov_73.736278_g1559_i0.p1  ORF type:complete len:140 (-),score=45.80 NODE_1963_length_796_cov_73.736278_g1559_i0:166-585(-)